ncbi:MAG TPA: hypothetical protein VI895_05695 [Bdellovibrionota bacterium]|nr:hypothetical protein [Bdellovibrionota bacterium]
MSGHTDLEDIRNIEERLQEIDAEIRSGDLALEDAFKRVRDAIQTVRSFRKSFVDAAFSVHRIQIGRDGTVQESPFDWHALESQAGTSGH